MSGLHGTNCGDLGDDNGSVLCQMANMYFLFWLEYICARVHE